MPTDRDGDEAGVETAIVAESERTVPSVVVAEIIAVPVVKAITSPSSFTDATSGLFEDQTTVLVEAFSGKTFAVRDNVSPIIKLADCLFSEIDSALTVS